MSLGSLLRKIRPSRTDDDGRRRRAGVSARRRLMREKAGTAAVSHEQVTNARRLGGPMGM